MVDKMTLEADPQAQEEEIEILMEVVDSDCFSKYEGATISGQMNVKLKLPGDSLNCKYINEEDVSFEKADNKVELEGGSCSSSATTGKVEEKAAKTLTFRHLPPVTLHFTLPPDYPSLSKPIFTLSSSWLSRTALSQLCKKLDELWEENQGMAILFTWHTFLKENALSSLGFTSQTVYDLTPFLQAVHNLGEGDVGPKNGSYKDDYVSDIEGHPRAGFERLPTTSVQCLFDYETLEVEREFLRTTHSCAICFSEKRGTDCILFLCGHVFCKECVRDFFSLHIKEGSLESVKCPEIECKVVPTPNEVKELVGLALFERYDTLLLSKTLDSMSDIMTCPRVSCGRPVFKAANEKLATCATCRYAFCTSCKMGYHGVEPCRLKDGETNRKVNVKYAGLSEKGKKLKEQEELSEKWLGTYTMPCPRCRVPIQKDEGCNKMTCSKCSTYFCWICNLQLDKRKPYVHFNDPSSPCYSMMDYEF